MPSHRSHRSAPGATGVIMADVFSMNDARSLLKNKFVLMIGDSNVRGMYKDLLCLLHQGKITPESILRRGSEAASQYGDEILDMADIKQGRGYYEVRQCKKKDLWLRFIFVTQVAAPSLMKEVKSMEEGKLPSPDIIVINSCLWDITRWGPEQEDRYKENVANLFHRLSRLLPPSSLVVWMASLPVATERVKGGVFIKQIEFMKHSMRFMLLEANVFVHNLCRVFHFSFLDLHYYMQYQLNRRTNDGLHWESPAVRYMANLLLTHIALAFNEPLPGNVDKTYHLQNLDKAREMALEGEQDSKKIYLDSKLVKYLEKLGMEMKLLTDEASSLKRKEELPEMRVKRQARRPHHDGGCNKSSVRQDNSHLVPGRLPSFGRLPDHHRVPPWLRKDSSQYSVVGKQLDGPPRQYLTANNPSGFIQPLFNNMDASWPLRSCGQQPSYSRLSNRSCDLPNQHHYNLYPNEFWQHYPVNTFPWNQHC